MTERYEIIKLIAKDSAGGMYLAQDTRLERKVVFRHIEAKADRIKSDEWSKEFSEFSGKLCALLHPNLMTIYDISIDDDGVCMVSQYIEGESLAERLEQGALKQIGVYRMASDLLEALHAAHSSDIFHGALHTGSVKRLPRATGGHRYLIVDLGLNTLATMIKGEDVHIADPVLLAPELHDEHAEPDAKADLFMLGQLCYTALAGGHPFAELSPEDCAKAHLDGDLPPLSKFAPHVQKDFASWVMSLTEGDRSKRPATVKEAMDSLQSIVIDEPLPNVPGKTHAVLASPSQKTTAQVVVSPDTESDAEHSESKKKFTKKLAMGIAALCVLIGLALWGVSRWRGGEDSSTADTRAAAPEGVLVYMHETNIVNTVKQRDKPVTVDFDTEKTLDWTVAKGAPVWEKREEKPGASYILSLFPEGKFKEFVTKKTPVKFNTDQGEIIPVAITNTGKKHRAKVGCGWQTNLRFPPKHKGAVFVTFYMYQKDCDFDIKVIASSEKETFSFNVPAGEPGVVSIPIEFTSPKGGSFYSITITASKEGTKKNFAMGMHGIHVERR